MATVQKGELVLITGGTGWVGSHIVDKALEHGLAVRLAIRSEAKAKGLIDGLRKVHGAQAHIETVTVQDFSVDSAYDEAVKGVKGIIHAASDLSFSDHFDEVVTGTIRSYGSLLQAAHRTSDIKRVVLTSSSTALGMPNKNGKTAQHFTRDSWNEAAVKEAKSAPNPWNVYAASKTLSEQFAWNFVKENKPSFTLNTVLPNMCFGRKVAGTEYMSTGAWAYGLLMEGETRYSENVAPQYHVDVDDVAILHILGLTQADVANERIIAFGERFSWDHVIDTGKKIRPDANPAPKSEATAAQDNTTVDVKRTQELLLPYGGLKSLEHSLKLNLE